MCTMSTKTNREDTKGGTIIKTGEEGAREKGEIKREREKQGEREEQADHNILLVIHVRTCTTGIGN